MPIHAPYNFVPLADKVFFPDWAGQVSQDIPFSDGISGELQCTLTAQSPIYVRNGGAEREQIMDSRINDSHSFFKMGDEYIIPGASLKGMLRSVIEIMSFAKMGRVDDEKYSFRDLTRNHPYLGLMRGAKAGWLTLNETDRQWMLSPCEFARVDHKELIELKPGAQAIKQKQNAKEKYAKWGQDLNIVFEKVRTPRSGDKAERLRLPGGKETGLNGTIVFTGQPSENNGQKNRKHLEFVFHTKSDQSFIVSQELMRLFESIHAESEDWKFHKERKMVPVFYLGKPDQPTSIGLAMMYRLPYNYSIHDAIKHTTDKHFDSKLDLAEILFGMTGNPEGLKGRIWVSQATAQNAEQERLVHTILGSPKPTYYPSYLEQPELPGKYKTLLDADSKVRGWKRYPARPFNAGSITVPTAEQASVATKYIPLKPGTQFDFKIKLHNLKPLELGALLWALEWGGDQNLCHGLGMGKAFGFGQVKVKVTGTKCISVTGAETQKDELARLFENSMNGELGTEWRDTPQMKQLLGMANPANAAGKILEHMKLESDYGNQFVTGKKKYERLEPYVSNPISKPVPKTAPPQDVTTERWENVRLTFDATKMEIGVSGKNATAQYSQNSPLVLPQVVFALKSNRPVKAHVTVETTNGKVYKIVKVEVI